MKRPLQHFISHGVAVIATAEKGATVGSWKDPANFATDRDRIAAWWAQGFRRFQFLPEAAGLVCLDVDRKNGKDGLRELFGIFAVKRIAPPAGLADPETFPARTETPSGGVHLYFRYNGPQRFRSGEIAEGLEVVHAAHLLTAPGSEKNGRAYRFFGSLDAAPNLPPVLAGMFTPYSIAPPVRPAWDFARKEYGELSLDAITEIIDRQGEHAPGSSRNRYCYEVARFARRKGYPAAETESFLRGRFESTDFDAREIAGLVASAYR